MPYPRYTLPFGGHCQLPCKPPRIIATTYTYIPTRLTPTSPAPTLTHTATMHLSCQTHRCVEEKREGSARNPCPPSKLLDTRSATLLAHATHANAWIELL